MMQTNPEKRSFVYVGLLHAPGGEFFVKIGKTDHPERRIRAYATHCPGGLDSMHASEVASSAAAFAAEQRLLNCLHTLSDGRWHGAEWALIAGDRLENMFNALVKVAGEPYRVHYKRGRRIANFAS